MGEIRRARNDRTDRGGTARREIRGGEATAGTEGCRGWNRSTRGRRVRNRSVNPKPVRNATRGSSANVDRAATPPSANPMRWRGARGGLLCRFRSLDTRGEKRRRGARTRSVRGSVHPSRATTLAGRTNERRGFDPSLARLFACPRARWGFVSSSSALLTAPRAPRGRAPGRGGGGVRDGVVVAPRHAGARWTRAAARRPTRARWARWARAFARSRCRTPRRGARDRSRARERDPRRRGGILRTLRPPRPRVPRTIPAPPAEGRRLGVRPRFLRPGTRRRHHQARRPHQPVCIVVECSWRGGATPTCGGRAPPPRPPRRHRRRRLRPPPSRRFLRSGRGRRSTRRRASASSALRPRRMRCPATTRPRPRAMSSAPEISSAPLGGGLPSVVRATKKKKRDARDAARAPARRGLSRPARARARARGGARSPGTTARTCTIPTSIAARRASSRPLIRSWRARSTRSFRARRRSARNTSGLRSTSGTRTSARARGAGGARSARGGGAGAGAEASVGRASSRDDDERRPRFAGARRD